MYNKNECHINNVRKMLKSNWLKTRRSPDVTSRVDIRCETPYCIIFISICNLVF